MSGLIEKEVRYAGAKFQYLRAELDPSLFCTVPPVLTAYNGHLQDLRNQERLILSKRAGRLQREICNHIRADIKVLEEFRQEWLPYMTNPEWYGVFMVAHKKLVCGVYSLFSLEDRIRSIAERLWSMERAFPKRNYQDLKRSYLPYPDTSLRDLFADTLGLCGLRLGRFLSLCHDWLRMPDTMTQLCASYL